MSDLQPQEKGNPEEQAHVRKSIVIDRPADELYDYWRDLENLPFIMSNVKSVSQADETHSLWVAEVAGKELSWKAEIREDEVNRKISWISVGDSEVWHRGSVHFLPLAADRTEIIVEIHGQPPAEGMPPGSKAIVSFLTGRQVAADLKLFKKAMEGGNAGRRAA